MMVRCQKPGKITSSQEARNSFLYPGILFIKSDNFRAFFAVLGLKLAFEKSNFGPKCFNRN